MAALTHKIGIVLNSVSADNPGYRKQLEDGIGNNNGIVHAEFSENQPDIVVVEFDPEAITANQIYKLVKALNSELTTGNTT